MALPYIDTQRLSLVWLGLESPKKIGSLESTLVGSREWRGAKKKCTAAIAREYFRPSRRRVINLPACLSISFEQ